MQTPLRRSKRGQPIVAGHTPSDVPQNATVTSVEDALHIRRSQPEDFTSNQTEQLQRDDIDIDDLQTHFYNHFTDRGGEIVNRATRAHGKGSRIARGEPENYYVGDTVLVPTMALEPSIAVITGVWTIRENERVLFTNASLHWFLRPKELPNVRARRSSEEVRFFDGRSFLLLTWTREKSTIRSRAMISYQLLLSLGIAQSLLAAH